jgi:transcriptional regulator with XRE-family HTH domain
MGDNMDFGLEIKRAREKMDLSLEAAAKQIREKYGVRLSAPYLNMIENGQRTNLTTNLEKALRSFFKIPLSSSEFTYTPLEDCSPLTSFIRKFSEMDKDSQQKTIQELLSIIINDDKDNKNDKKKK